MRTRFEGFTVSMLMIFIASSLPEAVRADSVRPALKTDWVYFETGYSPLTNTPCLSDESSMADSRLYHNLHNSNLCGYGFQSWKDGWHPISGSSTDGRTSWWAVCPPSGVAFTYGYQRTEVRNFDYWYKISSCPENSSTSTDSIKRTFYYYCADSANYELFQPAYSPGPMIPACRLKAGKLDVKKQAGSGDCCVGNPINIMTGRKYQEERDYAGKGPSPLSFSRHYYAGRWSTSYSRHIILQAINEPVYVAAIMVRDDGREETFKLTNGVASVDADVNSTLQRTFSSGGSPSGWIYRDTNDNVETYDENGRLQSVATRAGLLHTVAYDASGHVLSIADQFGHELTFSYDGAGRLTGMVDPAGGSYQYGYNAANAFASVTAPDGKTRSYVYNEPEYTSGANLPDALTGIIDEAGTVSVWPRPHGQVGSDV